MSFLSPVKDKTFVIQKYTFSSIKCVLVLLTKRTIITWDFFVRSYLCYQYALDMIITVPISYHIEQRYSPSCCNKKSISLKGFLFLSLLLSDMRIQHSPLFLVSNALFPSRCLFQVCTYENVFSLYLSEVIV
jgi:hypothetical protein